MISVTLVGLGNIGLGYDVLDGGFVKGQTKTHAKAILDSSDFELASFEDFSAEKLAFAQKIIATTSIRINQVRADDFVPDLAVIAVNTSQHLAVVESFVKLPKALIIEKPAGSSSSESSRISAWGLQNNVQIFVNYFRRFLSCSVETRLYLKEIQAGAFLSAEINAYGSLLNIFSHFIDLGLFLTNRQIFCDCANKTRRSVGDTLFIVCESCDSSFRLGGINKLKCDISMLLEFEFIEILITDDGKRIVIVDKVEQVSTMFECGFSEYENYQKVVYDKIGAMLRHEEVEKSYLGLEQAKKVHLFLESVDLNYEK
jgi:hypothetical protein